MGTSTPPADAATDADGNAGTVEWRTPDAAPPLDLCRLAADTARVVDRAVEAGTRVDDGEDGVDAADGAVTLPPFETLREYVDTAMADGFSPPSVGRYLAGFGFDPDAYRPVGAVVDDGDRVDPAVARRTVSTPTSAASTTTRSWLTGRRRGVTGRPSTGTTP